MHQISVRSNGRPLAHERKQGQAHFRDFKLIDKADVIKVNHLVAFHFCAALQTKMAAKDVDSQQTQPKYLKLTHVEHFLKNSCKFSKFLRSGSLRALTVCKIARIFLVVMAVIKIKTLNQVKLKKNARHSKVIASMKLPSQ